MYYRFSIYVTHFTFSYTFHLPGLNQYFTADKVSCSRTQHIDSSGVAARTSNPSIPSLALYQLSHCARLKSDRINVKLQV